MQIKEADYWDMFDEVLGVIEKTANQWHQLLWSQIRMATIVWVGDDSYPSLDLITEGLTGEATDSVEQLSKELKAINQSYSSKLIDDGKSEFSIKWEDEEVAKGAIPSDESF